MLVMLRIVPIFMLGVVPVFKFVPARILFAVALMLAVVIYSLLQPLGLLAGVESLSGIHLVYAGVLELLLGFSIASALVFIQMLIGFSGKLWDYAHGFSSLSAFNPGQSELVSIYNTVFLILFAFVFIALNLHHSLIEYIIASYHEAPIGTLLIWHDINSYLYSLSKMSFFVLVLSLPVVVVSLVFDVLFAYLMKTHAGFNIYFISLPAKVFLGLLMFAVTERWLVDMMEIVVNTWLEVSFG